MIPYIGSKYILSSFILPHVPKNPKFWVEPFGGMFGLFFDLNLSNYTNTQFIYNDTNYLNCNLFECLKNNNFINRIQSVNVSQSMFINCYDTLYVDDNFESALSWLIVLCCAESKDLMGMKYTSNSRFQLLKYKLPYYKEYFKRIFIENKDYKLIMNKYNSEESFFYIDPPYTGYEHYYLNSTFSSNNELYSIISDLKSKWILSNYKIENVEVKFPNSKIYSINSGHSKEYLVVK